MKPILVKEKVTLEAIGRLIERSIEKLATKEEVSKISSNVTTILERLDLMDKRFDAVDGKLLEFSGRFDKIDEKFDAVDQRFDKVESKIDLMDTGLTNQLDYVLVHYAKHSEFVLLDTRLKKLEKSRA